MRLDALLQGTEIYCPIESGAQEVTGLCYDSRKVKKGDAFICLKGLHTDGHIYAMDAVVRGAVVVIAEDDLELARMTVLKAKDSRKALSTIAANYYGHPSKRIRVFGVTGTNGKTTVSFMIKNCLKAEGQTCGLTGTISYQVGDKEYEATYTTPESLDLQGIFAEIQKQQIPNCVMEVSSHALYLGRVDNIEFDYGIFTNLTQDHMDFHKNREEYYQAKKRLFSLVKKGAIINIDDESGRRLHQELGEEGTLALISCSLKDKKADYYGEILERSERGSKLLIINKGIELGVVTIHSPGIFSLYNGLVAAACLHTAGISFAAIQKGLEDLKGVPGRFELIENSKNMVVIVDYAHTPDALEKVLRTAAEIVKGRLICIFGCGGERDITKRPLMGKIAGSYSDYCIITSDNPRTESQQQIATDIEGGLYETGCNYEIIEDRRKAIAKAVSIYRKGDLILIAGKGHETYQIIGGSKTYFSDQETVRELIETTDRG